MLRLTALLGYLVPLLAIAAQWVGVMALRRSPRTLPWWLMLAGVTCGTLGLVAYASLFLRGGAVDSGWELHMSVAAALSTGGALGFGIGFALHSVQTARAHSRVAELEQVAAAMSEEIERLSKGGTAT